MLGQNGSRTPKADILVAIIGLVVVAIRRTQVVLIVVVPGTPTQHLLRSISLLSLKDNVLQQNLSYSH